MKITNWYRKYSKVILMIFIAVCLLFTLSQAVKVKTVNDSVTLGFSEDKELEITKNTIVCTNFQMLQDDFGGVQIKLDLGGKKYTKEILSFELLDKSGDKLAWYEMPLKYEMDQEYALANIPLRGYKGQQVSLVIYGRNIEETASIYLSERQNSESELFINGEEQTYSIVMTEEYKKIERNIVSPIINMALILFVFFLFHWWMIRQPDTVSKNKNTMPLEKTGKIFRKYKKIIVFLLVMFIMFVSYVFVYKLVVSKVGADYGYIKKMYAVLCILLTLFVCGAYYLIVIKRAAIEKCFVYLAFSLGIIYCMSITMYGVPDEPSHIDTAYRYSNIMMRTNQGDDEHYIYKRCDDVDMQVHTQEGGKTDVNKKSYKYLKENLFSLVKDNTLVRCAARDNSGNGGGIYYIPAAIGITIGRILHLGTLPMLMLGRLFNLFTFVFLAYLGIKKIPFGKLTMILIALLPITMQEAASFSYDAVIMGLIVMFTGYVLSMAYTEEKISEKDILILILLCIVTASAKGGVYLPLCLLLALVPYKRQFRKKESILYFAGLIVLCGFAFLKNNISNILNTLLKADSSIGTNLTENDLYSLGYLLKHPGRFIMLYANTIQEKGDTILAGLLGGRLGWVNIYVPWFILIVLFLLIISSCMLGNKYTKKIKSMDRIIAIVIILGCGFLIGLSMLVATTPVKSNYIMGIQGRYFVPIIFVIFMLIHKRKILWSERGILFTFGFMHIFVISQIVISALG